MHERDDAMESVITRSWKMENEEDKVTPVLRSVPVTDLDGVCFMIQNTCTHGLEIMAPEEWAKEF